MCEKQECTDRTRRELRRHRDADYSVYGPSDECFCGFIHFDKDGNLTNHCPREEKFNETGKYKWRDIREVEA